MKTKIFYIITLLTLCMFAKAQGDITVSDKVDADGFRWLSTSEVVYSQKGLIRRWFYLSRYVFDQENLECEDYLVIPFNESSTCTLPAGSKLYIKLDNDEIITLETSKELTALDNTLHTTWIGHTLFKTYKFVLRYKLSDEVESLLLSHEVVKMRFELPWAENGYFTVPAVKKEVIEFNLPFTQSISILNSHTSTSKNILEDF